MRQEEMIGQMTDLEKAAFLSGKNEWQSRDIPRLGITSIFFADGPHGIRKQAGAGDHLGLNPSLPATCFPTAATVANSWNPELAEEIGEALGEEAAALGVNVLLGPGLNIKRSPLCGRNFEYFSEDPYLTGKMAAAYIRGIQKNKVYACPKHFAVNSQELRRMAMNAVVDERTLREIYLTGFEMAIKEGGAKAIMTSYNQVNGVYANENKHLLLDILRGEWQYEGIVVTDWGGSNDHVRGVAARSNLEMPTPGLDSARQILKALENSSLDREQLDICVNDLLHAVLELTDKASTNEGEVSWETHHELAGRASAESIVLLKNAGEGAPLLPLPQNCNVALIGDFAITPRYQGAGSSAVNPVKEAESMKNLIDAYSLNCIGCLPGYLRSGKRNQVLTSEALELAKKADAVIYCFGLNEVNEAEGTDRNHMRIPQNQIELLEALAKVNENIVGVISGGAAVEMPWQHCLKAILHGYLGGQAGAGAMLDVLTGKVNPSGRLAETYPIRYEDTPAFRYFPSEQRNSEYREALYVGYRYYDTSKVRVQYPFGYGLSYTDFTYTDLQITEEGVSLVVKNTGERDGAEVVQMYVGFTAGKVFRPEKELKGFQKVFLKAGEEKRIKIPFDDKTFRYFNVRTEQWEIEGGTYQIMVGASTADIRLSGEWCVKGTTEKLPYEDFELPSYRTGFVQNVPKEEYEHLLGHPIPFGEWSGELGRNDAVCQMYYAKSWLARWIYQILTKKKSQNEANGTPDLNLLFQYNIPFRAIAKMTGGMVSMEMIDSVLLIVNGHFWKGLGGVIVGFVRNYVENRRCEVALRERKDYGKNKNVD